MASRSTPNALGRRELLHGLSAIGGLGLVGLSGCATAGGPAAPDRSTRQQLAPLRASIDRIIDITVCLRPFRAAGPRLDVERLGDTLVVHNYGHGGSGWSLSWGSSTLAVRKAMETSPREVAVVGCGALGLTSALLAQAAGAQVTIYARDLLPDTRSSRATGSWTPDSRIASKEAAPAGFASLWEQMARTSMHTYRRYLGLPGHPVEWADRYMLSDNSPTPAVRPSTATQGSVEFATYRDLIRDITPGTEKLPPATAPFPTDNVSRTSEMVFNIAAYGHTLMTDFFAAGGKFVRAEFQDPSQLARLKEKVVINCPGYGARALWRDESIIPVRGQVAVLVPQSEVNYGLYYRRTSMVPRRDGIIVQSLEGGDMKGYGSTDETPDRSEAERAVQVLADLSARTAARSQT